MTFDEVLTQVIALLQQEQRVSYRGLKRRFALDDEYLEDLKEELIGAKRLAIDEDGRFLVWTDGESKGEKAKERNSEDSPESRVQSRESAEQERTSTVLTLDSRRQTLDATAERRQLTVMFIDLVGSTTLSQQLDPEDYHARVVAYQAACRQVIARYEGYIAQYLGDGVLVYFGYPTAHEDDAVRAVRSGLEIVAAVGQLAYTPPLQVRIGIHTGLVVIGEIGSSEKREMLALGETPNIAARIQGTANPDEVMISAATYRLVEGLFACEDRGQPDLKGVAMPLTLYRVGKESDAHSRFEVVVRRGLTPLIGRDHEFGLLQERWARVKEGAGQVVLLSGEPGIGKSRLVEALKETVEREGARCLELRCSPYTQNSALHPIIEHLQRTLQFQQSYSPEEKLWKLVQAVEQRSGAPARAELSGEGVIASRAKQSLPQKEIASSPSAPRNDTTHLREVVPLFAALLSLPHPEGFPALTLSPQKQREKTHEALVAWLCAEAKQQAVTYAWEDLHWADPSTLELLTLFLAQVPTTRLLAVLTYRPEFTPPWGAHSYLSQLTLSRLGQTHVEVMVEKVTGGKALPPEIVRQIASKTDGVPLFVEELTKTVLESVGSIESIESGGRLGPSSLHLGIPATLQDALMARLDRLGPAKEIAQLGATLGREFNYDLLHAVFPHNEETLQQGLRQLVETELVFQSGIPPQARYLFKHALVQDTAYQSLLKSRRQQLHQQVAQVLDEKFPQIVETQPELVAHHYTEANLIEQAIPYWQKAGERASQRSAYVEAVAHLNRGLELLKTLANTPEHVHQELILQLTLNDVLITVRGEASPDVEKTVLRAQELCQQLGETPQLFPVLWRLVVFYINRGELQTTYKLAEQMMRLAQSVQDPDLLWVAHFALGAPSLWLGELVSARRHLEQAIALSDDPQKRLRHTIGTADSRVNCLFYASWTLWYLGYPDQALKRNQEAMALAEGLSHPFSLAVALGFAALFHHLRREVELVRERAEAVMALSTEQEFPYFLASGTLMRGWALVEQGQVQEGIVQIRQGMATFRAMGVEALLTRRLAMLAEAHGKMEQIEEGLTLLAEAFTQMVKTGEHVYEAEVYRLYGELSLRAGEQANRRTGEQSEVALSPDLPVALSSPEACFLKAIEIARKQRAKSLELRASTSLARLWQQQGKKEKAHQMLSEVYNWFTEGFDTKDLQEAKTLLEELSH